MSISGSVNIVNSSEAEVFFLPLVLGTGVPSQGYARALNTPFVVTLTTGFMGSLPVPPPKFSISTTVKPDGSFEFVNSLPPGAPTEAVQLTVSLHNTPMYRTETFHLSDTAKPMNVYLFQPNSSTGITAGQVSQGLAKVGLPDNTVLSAKSGLIGVVGSQSGADITFNVSVVPDTSHILTNFVDLALGHYDIHVGFPADCSLNADGVLAKIKASLGTADSAANQIILGVILKALGQPPLNLPSQTGQKLLNAVSIQFSHLTFPLNVSWPLSNQTDTNVVIVPQVVIGWPRFF
jgi:hypothetical protein